MKRIHAVGVVAAMLLFAPFEVTAKSNGAGFATQHHSIKPAPSHRSFANGHGFRRAPWGWGFIAPNYLVAGEPANEVVVFPPGLPRVLDCVRHREITEVPSERGGTREIMVTRC